MGGLSSYFTPRVWIVVLSLLGVAIVPFFLPPSVVMAIGFTVEEYILVVGLLELAAALGIAAIVIYHHDAERESSEWEYEP
jgi:hypothetical protein